MLIGLYHARKIFSEGMLPNDDYFDRVNLKKLHTVIVSNTINQDR
jgi:hypothetical protein